MIHCTLATLMYCNDSEIDIKDYILKWDLEDKSIDDIVEEI